MSARLRYVSTTLALVAIGLGYALIQGKPWRSAPRPEARPLAARSPVPRPPAPPTAREILGHEGDLSLTADQKARLEALDLRWKGEAAGLEAAIKQAEQEFSRFMQETQAGGKTSVQEIQRRSADLQSLSVALRERRQLHVEEATRLLTPIQRQKLSAGTSTEQPGGNP